MTQQERMLGQCTNSPSPKKRVGGRVDFLRYGRLTVVLLLGLVGFRCASCVDAAPHPLAVKHNDVGIEYLKQGQCREARERFRLALEYGEDFEHPHNGLGMVALRCDGDLDKAAQHFKDAINVNEDFAEAHNNLGVCFFRQDPPNYVTACEEFLAAIEIDPGFLDARENYGMCLMRRGTIVGDKGDMEQRKKLYREARSHLIRLLEMDPNNFNARHHLGFMDLMDKNYEAAEQNFKRCLEIDPENPICSYNLGNTYIATARCSEAIQSFISALRNKQESEVSIGARNNLGLAYVKCAEKDAAIKEFLDRIKLDPGNPAHHYDLGNIYLEKGFPDKAVNEWENTVKLDPLYCAPYYDLAMQANKTLDTQGTLRRCQDFVVCVSELSRTEPQPAFDRKNERCKGLVKKLQLE
jgi:tetratricopeptide (TPR) repeat protein